MESTPTDPLDDAVFDHITAVFAAPVPLDEALTLIMQRTCSLLLLPDDAPSTS